MYLLISLNSFKNNSKTKSHIYNYSETIKKYLLVPKKLDIKAIRKILKYDLKNWHYDICEILNTLKVDCTVV